MNNREEMAAKLYIEMGLMTIFFEKGMRVDQKGGKKKAAHKK